MLKDADGAAVQQFAGHPDLLRQSHTRMLDQLDQLIRCQPAKGFCVLLVGHQRGFDYPGEIDAIVSHHRDVLRDAQPRFGQGVVAAQCGKVIREDDAGGPLRQCQQRPGLLCAAIHIVVHTAADVLLRHLQPQLLAGLIEACQVGSR